MLFVDRAETINHIISECGKLAQNKYKTGHDWFGKVISQELCEKFKFDYMNNMYNLGSVQENDMLKLLWKSEIQTDHLNLARRPDQLIDKKNKIK